MCVRLRVCRDIQPGTELLVCGDAVGKRQAADEAAAPDEQTGCAGSLSSHTLAARHSKPLVTLVYWRFLHCIPTTLITVQMRCFLSSCLINKHLKKTSVGGFA